MGKSRHLKPGVQEWTASDGSRWIVRTGWAEVGGRAECVNIAIESVDDMPRPITTSLLRSVPFASLIEADALEQAGAGPPAMQAAEGRLFTRGRKVVGPGGSPLPPAEVLAEVAAIYREAWGGQGPARRNPTQAVAEKLAISRSAAAKRVRRARDAGLLPETTRGRASAAEPAAES